jgi:hypothetical protein
LYLLFRAYKADLAEMRPLKLVILFNAAASRSMLFVRVAAVFISLLTGLAEP